ncbi:hypothetical protein SK1NUM_04100 [Arachnia rubra]|nr:hypothetical protein SK1NUM_04100 [Arachnia rubra]
MKFKIRKAIALAAVAALALTGCSSKGGGSDTTGENGKTRIVVDMWAGGQKDTDALKKQVEIAQKALPDIQIELRTAPWGDFFTKLTTNMGTDNMACVTGMNSGKLTDYKSGFAELTEADLATAGLKSSDFAKDATQILSNGGTMYGLPFDMATMLVYHNADMISSTGAPPAQERVDLRRLRGHRGGRHQGRQAGLRDRHGRLPVAGPSHLQVRHPAGYRRRQARHREPGLRRGLHLVRGPGHREEGRASCRLGLRGGLG